LHQRGDGTAWITSGPTATMISSNHPNIDDRMKFLIPWGYGLSYHVNDRLSIPLMLKKLLLIDAEEYYLAKDHDQLLLTSVGISFGLYIYLYNFQ